MRAADRISFVYLDRCVINRDSNAITATDERGTVHIPAAAVGVLLLGPGTTITHQAIALMSDSGSTVVWVGERGVRYYAHGASLARTSRLVQAQAEAVSNSRSRLRIARTMYEMRFPDENVSELTMQQLRGREGTRVRRIYREHAERTGVEWTGRSYDRADWDNSDPINQALSAANAALYGVVHSVIVALGCSPALGFVHTGHHRSFVYDIADLYKADITIPAAFEIAAGSSLDVAGETRRQMRDALHEGKLLQRCAHDIQLLLLGEDSDDTNTFEYFEIDAIASLWDERQEPVSGGVSYGDES
ncbi:type I-E CRISPR-associated endonuclease Cas1e [Amycolatopsis sp. PS_44_ISF1]|uniref:type I-E CRISPR-associated endonuclease Cas1e n=1 Tax=Amycolatopsis sp. PS_44_ISF1 TaxID=2974917 RepID=UPI0028DDB8CB|nr:type I-E CRISPR-associated endonuclease Cas1e [Amycolatopsis sp. PS_44_ISF1]MDT8915131.1 type I-E CRISPR-associated endonuclease Cas1e [Amycolatopsis sp. PS_44_ISF1]